jgi:hypothetical protein
MTPHSRSIRKLLLLLVAALVLSVGVVACGGDDGTSTSDKNDYIKQVNDAQNEFLASVQKLNFTGGSPSDVKKALDGLDPALTKVVKDLDSIDPPKEVAAEHDKLVQSLRDYQSTLNENKDAIASGDQQAAQKFSTESSKFASQFDATVNEINTKLRQ